MKSIVTSGIVLRRTDFQEADRILTILTPDHGKVHLIAKGVRRPRSKIAGGIELLSVSDITFSFGRGEIGKLISARMVHHFSNIIADINRTMLTYQLIKIINKTTEDAAEKEYFELLELAFKGLDSLDLPSVLTRLWFDIQMLKITGHTPNLNKDSNGDKFVTHQNYLFNYETMTFEIKDNGPHTANLIKLLRLAHVATDPFVLGKVVNVNNLAENANVLVAPLIKNAYGIS
ncbi:MAG: hypothetical protein NVS1B7_5750 [Candidatus Saccharimonadales bacterium]